eukprot:7721364-Pyramimonas_sp.AAC.1
MMVSRRPKTPPRIPGGLQEASQDGPERQKSLIFHVLFMCFLVSPCFRFLRLQDQDCSKTAQDASKRAPGRPKRAPRPPRIRPRRPK